MSHNSLHDPEGGIMTPTHPHPLLLWDVDTSGICIIII